MPPGSSSNSNRKVANGLVALSSAAIVAVYSAGYFRTKAAADRFERHAADRRATDHAVPAGVGAPSAVGESTSAVTTPADAPPSRAVVTSGAGSAASERGAAAADVVPLARAGATPLPITSGPVASPPSESLPSESPSSEPQAAHAEVAPAAPSAPPAVLQADVPASVEAPAVVRGRYADGTYLGWGSCRHGDIQAAVVVEGGHVKAVTIAQCLTRYNCNWIDPLLPQVVSRQSADVDYVSGATESSYAFADAVADALSKAK